MRMAIWFSIGVLLGAWVGWILGSRVTDADGAAPGSVVERSTAAPDAMDTEAAAGPGGASSASDLNAPRAAHSAAAPRRDPDADPAGLVLYGAVTDRAGRPVPSCTVAVGDVDRPRSIQFVQTRDGRGFALAGLEAGPATLTVRADGYREQRVALVLDADEPVRRHDVRLERAFALAVELVDGDGKPLLGALRAAKLARPVDVFVIATSERPNAEIALGTLAGGTRYGIGSWRSVRAASSPHAAPPTGALAGTLALDRAPPVFVSAVVGHVVLATVAVDPQVERVRLEVPLGALTAQLAGLRVRVTEAETGAALAGVRAALTDPRLGGPSLRTDARGVVTFADVPPGLYDVEVVADERERYRVRVRLRPGSTAELDDVALHRAVTVRGRVVDALGRGVPGATLVWQNLDRVRFAQLWPDQRTARSGAAGVFALHGLGPGRWAVQARTDAALGTAIVELAAGATARDGGDDELVDLTLEPCLELALDATALGAGAARLVTIRGAGGVPVWAGRVTRDLVPPVAVPAGTYVCEVADDDGVLRSAPLRVATDTTRTERTVEVR